MSDDVRCVQAYAAKDGSLHWTHSDAAKRNAEKDRKREALRERRRKTWAARKAKE